MTTVNRKIHNQWLIQNNVPVQRIKKQLMEYSFKGQTDLPVRTIQGLIESSIIEIGRLQCELDDANSEIQKLKQERDAAKEKTKETE